MNAEIEKMAIITGASRGIGLSLAKMLNEENYFVVIISRSRPNSSFFKKRESVKMIQGDLSELSALSDLLKGDHLPRWLNELIEFISSTKISGPISLVHNASVLKKDSVDNLNSSDFLDVLKVNVIAPQVLNRIIIPKMGKGSSVIYIGSTLSEKAVKNSFSYVTSKHALAGMMRSTCQDVEGRGIHTALVCPGFTDTEMLRTHVGVSEKKDEGIFDILKNKTAYKRLIDPCEVAQLIKFAIENPICNGAIWHGHMGQIES